MNSKNLQIYSSKATVRTKKKKNKQTNRTVQNHGQSILQKENKTWDPVPIQTLVFWMSDALNPWSSDIEAVGYFQNTVWSWCWISVLSAVNTGSLYFEVNLCNHGAHLSFYAAYIMSLDTVQFSRCFALTLKDVSRVLTTAVSHVELKPQYR